MVKCTSLAQYLYYVNPLVARLWKARRYVMCLVIIFTGTRSVRVKILFPIPIFPFLLSMLILLIAFPELHQLLSELH